MIDDKIDSSGRVIRMVRYNDAEIVNLSVQCKDVTFNATPASSYAMRGQKTNRWAYYKPKLENILMEAIGSHRSVSILVYRYMIQTEGSEDGKPKYDTKDVIVTAVLNSLP